MNFLIQFFRIYIITIIIFNETNGYVLLAANVDDFRHIAKKIISKNVVDKLVDTLGNNKDIENVEAVNDKIDDDHVGLDIADMSRDEGPVDNDNFDPYRDHVYTGPDKVTKTIRKIFKYNIQNGASNKGNHAVPNPTENWDDKPFFEDVEIGHQNKKGEEHLLYDKFDLTRPTEEAPDYGVIVKKKPRLEQQGEILSWSSEGKNVHESGRFKIKNNKERHTQPASREQYNENDDRLSNNDKNVYESGRFQIKHNRKEPRDKDNEQGYEDTKITTRDHYVQKKERYETHLDTYESENGGISSNIKNMHNKKKDREYSLELTENYKNKENGERDQKEISTKYDEQGHKANERGRHRPKSDSKEDKRRPDHNEMKEKVYRDNIDDYHETRYEERHRRPKHKNRDNEERPRHIEGGDENRNRYGNNKQKDKYADSGEEKSRDQHSNNKQKDKYAASSEEKSRDQHGNNKQKDKHANNKEEKNRGSQSYNKQKDKYVDSGEEKSAYQHGNNNQKYKYVDSREEKNRGQHGNNKQRDKYAASSEEKSRDQHGNNKQRDKYANNKEEKNRGSQSYNKQKDKYVDSGEEKSTYQHGNNKQKDKYVDSREEKNRGQHGNNNKKHKNVDSGEENGRDRLGNNKQKHKYVDSREGKSRDRHTNNKQNDRNEHRNKDYSNDKYRELKKDGQINQDNNKGRFEMISNENEDIVRPGQKKSDSRNNERVPKMGTKRPKGVTRYKQASPNYFLKDPNIADKYDFNEPLPEKDRNHENKKDIIIGDTHMKINGKLKS